MRKFISCLTIIHIFWVCLWVWYYSNTSFTKGVWNYFFPFLVCGSLGEVVGFVIELQSNSIQNLTGSGLCDLGEGLLLECKSNEKKTYFEMTNLINNGTCAKHWVMKMKCKYLRNLFKRPQHLQPWKKIQIKTTLRFPLILAKLTKINSNKQRNGEKCWHGFTFFIGSGSTKQYIFLTLY